ncbi:MAG: hypothetical protein J5674_05335 [Candidatus Methanomethylophilaceae archaeon]|nr:hypothetical protein [Candidatus Methanomethylophilaceae archaeon]
MGAFRLRMLFYLVSTFQDYLSENGMTVYDIGRRQFPKWEAYVIYVGKDGVRLTSIDGITGNLSDDSMSTEISVRDAGLLRDYINVCGIINDMAIGDCERESVLKAFEACKDCGTVGEFVWSRRFEIMGVYEQLFDEEENLRMNCEAHKKMGRLEGRAEGMAEGRWLQNEEVARKLVSMGMSAEDVSKATGMTAEEVRRLGRAWSEGEGAVTCHPIRLSQTILADAP